MDFEIEQNNATNNLLSIMDPVNTSWIFSTIILIGVIMLLIFFLCIVVFLYNQNQSKLKKMKASTLSLNQEIISLRKNNNEAWIIINRQQRKLRDQRNSEYTFFEWVLGYKYNFMKSMVELDIYVNVKLFYIFQECKD